MRQPIFDPTDEVVFAQRREGYDWHLLQNAAIHRVNTVEELGRADSMLSELGYAIHRLDAATWRNHDSIYSSFATSFDFPGGGGANLDALNDYLRDVAEFRYGVDPGVRGTAVLATEYQGLIEAEPGLSEALLGICAETARYAALLGHPMLFLFSCSVPMAQAGSRDVLLDEPLRVGSGGSTG